MRETYLCLICVRLVLLWATLTKFNKMPWWIAMCCRQVNKYAEHESFQALLHWKNWGVHKPLGNVYCVTWKMAYQFFHCWNRDFWTLKINATTNTRDVMSNYLKRNVTSGRTGERGWLYRIFLSLLLWLIFDCFHSLDYLNCLEMNPKFVHRFKLELFFEPRNSQILSLLLGRRFSLGSVVALYSAVSVKMTIFLGWLGFQAL